MSDRIFSRVCTCGICGDATLTNESYLPDGWMITWEYSTTLCDNCVARWVAKWGKEPNYYMKGGEKELKLI